MRIATTMMMTMRTIVEMISNAGSTRRVVLKGGARTSNTNAPPLLPPRGIGGLDSSVDLVVTLVQVVDDRLGLLLRRRQRQDAGGRARAAADLGHHGGQIAGSLNAL
jgi:hypothetical protein